MNDPACLNADLSMMTRGLLTNQEHGNHLGMYEPGGGGSLKKIYMDAQSRL